MENKFSNNRYIGALIIAPFVIFLFLGGIFLKCATFLLSIMGMYEFYKVTRRKGYHTASFISYLMAVAYYLLLNNNMNYKYLFFLLSAAVMLMLCIPVINIKFNYVDIALTLFGFFYVVVFFSFITLVNQKPSGNYLVWFIFITSWLCDTTAYYIGKYLGKHKLCPKVSPKKTIEGSVGGLLGSVISCSVYAYVISTFGVKISIYDGLFMGLISGILCQFGDLAASSIKRHCGVKDYSNLIPGHGGILDRFDSILFASVVVYYYVTFIMGI